MPKSIQFRHGFGVPFGSLFRDPAGTPKICKGTSGRGPFWYFFRGPARASWHRKRVTLVKFTAHLAPGGVPKRHALWESFRETWVLSGRSGDPPEKTPFLDVVWKLFGTRFVDPFGDLFWMPSGSWRKVVEPRACKTWCFALAKHSFADVCFWHQLVEARNQENGAH